ncbi:bifunctional folylpolyglutamate synthase/dihydrofolate synthase [Oceaniglobus ichthyenteri]|uniref:bifunctional folylpolyglutamate synthase/dihydrofolate synthase n=1 Tax=Oceaniglobus ichthyenteri TaxID=2136177 RepID=UPI001F0C9E9B|nr:folylpolyglutamate synthase/dihydrofolate synthase family protein [Oceaniglobus ichthyenteri]
MTTGSDAILAQMMALHPKIIDLTLDRMWRLLARLGHPERDLPPVIHIAGTNGKGSTLSMIRAGLEAAGHTAHAYTSPHLARFHERIRLAGSLIDEPYLSAILDECYRANGDAPITYFEITTCAALLAFARTPADYTLLEVGLGGRLDATNVVDQPALTVITPVSIDHQQFLGDTLAEIAGEKAGILKRGVPCIVARQDDTALDVIESRAARLGAPLKVYGQDWHVVDEHGRLVFTDTTGLLDLAPPALPGLHQFENAGTALAALRHLGVREPALQAALSQAQWPARMQRLRSGPLVDLADGAQIWLDGGHNPAAGQAIAQTLGAMPMAETHLICGMLNTKDITGFLRPLAAHAAHLHAVDIPGETNTLPAETTAAAARDAGISATTAASVASAITEISEKTPRARILICGSLYLAGRILQENA